MQKVSKARTIDIFSKQHVFLNLYIFIQREDKYWNKIRKKKLEDLKVRVLFGFFLKLFIARIYIIQYLEVWKLFSAFQ